jgi:hypothetical protein
VPATNASSTRAEVVHTEPSKDKHDFDIPLSTCILAKTHTIKKGRNTVLL